ncbi:uncharacterized protein ARMOST_14408 [Armillaria ostoyae]|uniref:Uncharacterized protein n=1 Tax=Armillaria ostoyae TaxID=47428 RepID=A0A284RQG2_ARMOS|nr:uncharacterized protein ARMOST_14408 [Armillaria ostoyae]
MTLRANRREWFGKGGPVLEVEKRREQPQSHRPGLRAVAVTLVPDHHSLPRPPSCCWHPTVRFEGYLSQHTTQRYYMYTWDHVHMDIEPGCERFSSTTITLLEYDLNKRIRSSCLRFLGSPQEEI